LGRRHGIGTPVNDACVRFARELEKRNEGPGILTTREFSARYLTETD